MADLLGKIGHHQFELWMKEHCGTARPEVLAGPAFGVDVSVVSISDQLTLVSTSDPLSLIPSLGLQESAWLSVHLMANDMATSGHAPQYGQFVLNLPPDLIEADFKSYWGYIDQYCKDLGMAITGGHTGFIEGQNSTIAGGGTFSSVVDKGSILLSSGAEEGDCILLSKSAALSSAAILAMSFPERVKNSCGKECYQSACEDFYRTSSMKEGLMAGTINLEAGERLITAMHDVTEGGVYGAVYEMMVASHKGAVLYDDALPVGQPQQKVCELFGLDPRYCIGAGSMVISCRPWAVERVVKAMNEGGIPCTKVGEVKPPSEGIKIQQNSEWQEFEYVEQDPYWAAFFKAIKAGWR